MSLIIKIINKIIYLYYRGLINKLKKNQVAVSTLSHKVQVVYE